MLSTSKFEKFVNDSLPLEMTCELWSKLRFCFYMNKEKSLNEVDKNRLTNVSTTFIDNGTVKVTSSSVNGNSYPRNAVDVHNTENFFQSNNYENS